MHILLSNDDGYQANGLNILAQTLTQFTDKISIVAPDRNRSGASNSLTLENPLRVTNYAKNYFYVNGTPTDCIHLALTKLLQEPPDIVISGINHGANMGDDVMYSGTVAAAVEASTMGLPALAISLASTQSQYFETAAKVILKLLNATEFSPFTNNSLYNINVPDVPFEQLKATTLTRLGKRHHAEPAIEAFDPHGQSVYWIGPPGIAEDAGKGTDFHAIKNNQTSITPIKVDMTDYNKLDNHVEI